MRVRKQCNVDVEVEVHVDAEDIARAISEQDGNRLGVVLQGINGCAQWIRAIPDSMIQEMNAGQREIVSTFLQEQAVRFK